MAEIADKKSQTRALVGLFTLWVIVLAVIALVLARAAGDLSEASGVRPWLMVLTAVATFALLILLGARSSGRGYGMLIDDRNKVSLSRLQMALWSSIVLAGIYVAALANVLWYPDASTLVEIPPELYALIGLSTVSMVGSPLVRSIKKTQKADGDELNLAVDKDAIAAGNEGAVADGKLMRNTSSRLASLSDLVMGEEVGNTARIDLAKVQMLLFTVVVAIVYVAMLWRSFGRAGGIDALPVLDATLITLLGISHAGYLTHKAVPHSKPG